MTKEQLEEQQKVPLRYFQPFYQKEPLAVALVFIISDFPKSQKELFTRTDDALYKAKEKEEPAMV